MKKTLIFCFLLLGIGLFSAMADVDAKRTSIDFFKKGFLSTENSLLAEQGTIEFWFKPISCANNEWLLSAMVDKDNYMSLGFNPTVMIFYVKTDGKGAYATFPKEKIVLDAWHHLACVYSKGAIDFYLNGEKMRKLVSSGNLSLEHLASAKLRLGCGNDVREQYNGKIAYFGMSDNIRYSQNFTPSLPNDAIADKHTIVAWNFQSKSDDKSFKSCGQKKVELKIEGEVKISDDLPSFRPQANVNKIFSVNTSPTPLLQNATPTVKKELDPPRRQINRSTEKGIPVAWKGESISIVENNAPQAVIVIPDADDGLKAIKPAPSWIEFQSYSLWDSSSRRSAELLTNYIFKSTSVQLEIYKESNVPNGKAEIHVGRTKFAEKLGLLTTTKDSSGFIIKFADSKRVVLLGGSELGTEYAVCEFLERFLGIRWLFPGELGECVPTSNSLIVSGPDINQEPKFYSRLFRVISEEGMIWCRRNRIHSRIEFHHNIPKLFDLSYTKSNPEFFPLINGQIRLPKKFNQDNWHLCYAKNDSAQVIADKLLHFFEKKPEYESVSLGVSDGDNNCYCQCPTCQLLKGDKINAFKFNDYSDMYYQWVNKVAVSIEKSFPQKHIGTLAYREVMAPPDKIKIHENVVPYVTWEFLQWIDPQRREQFKAFYSKWQKQAKHMGVYDYVWVGNYDIPLAYFHVMGEYIRYLSENKGVGYYAEMHPCSIKDVSFSGPTTYLLAHLLWNPQLNIDELLTDWYVSAVGEKAAPFLAKYYSIWENYWVTRIRDTAWFGKQNDLYLPFNQMGYLAKVTESDIDQSLALLKKTLNAAGAGAQKQRAQLLYDEFVRREKALRYQCAMYALQDTSLKEFKVKNGKVILSQDFSSGTQEWKLRREAKEVPWDAQQGNFGPGSLKIKAYAKGLADGDVASTLVMWQFKVKPGNNYLLEFYAKADKLPENAQINIVLDWRDQNKDEKKLKPYKLFLQIYSKELSSEWRKFQFKFSTPFVQDIVETHYFDAWLITRKIKDGAYWIDDMKIIEINE